MGARSLLVVLAAVVTLAGIALWVAVRHGSPVATPTRGGDAAAARVLVDAAAVIAAPPRDGLVVASPERGAGETLLADLRASGTASEVWAAQGTALLDDVARRAIGSRDVGCFVAGCGGAFTFASEADYAERRAELERSAGYAAWTGGKRWTELERERDGRVIVALLLYRPD